MKKLKINFFLLFFILLLFVTKNYDTILGCHPVAVKKAYFGKISGFPSNEVTTVAADKKGNIYIGTEDAGLIVITHSKNWKQIRKTEHGLTFDAIHKLYVDSFDNLWICTASGLNLSKGGSISRKYYAIDGLKDNICLSICEVERGSDLWIGTTKGLIHKTSSFNRLTDADGLPSNIVQALSSDIQGNIWVGTSEGLAKLEFNNFRKIPLKVNEDDTTLYPWIYDLESKKIYDLDYIRKISLSYDALLLGVEKKRDSLINPNDEIYNSYNEIINLIKDAKNKFQNYLKTNAVYTATSNGLFIVDIDSFQAAILSEGWFTAIAAQPSGRIYAANKELKVFPINEISALFNSYNISSEIKNYIMSLIDLAKDASPNDPEIGSVAAYITELRNTGIRDFSEWLDGFLANKSITDMIFAPNGDLWITIKGVGVFKFSPNFVNHDACIYALQGFLTEAGSQNIRFSNNFRLGLNVTSRSILTNPEIINEVKYAVRSYNINILRNPQLWIGNWCEMSDNECKFVAEFIGRYSASSCVINLANVLAENPIIAIPLGEISSVDFNELRGR